MSEISVPKKTTTADAPLSAKPQKHFSPNRILLWIIGAIILLAIFSLGTFVGFMKADFSYGWGENYHRVFGGPRGGFLQDFEGRDFINGHGTVGTIAKIDGNNLVIKEDEVEKAVLIDANTTIVRGRQTIAVTDLKLNERVVVIGTPDNNGVIQAQFIRVFDLTMPPPLGPAPTSFWQQFHF